MSVEYKILAQQLLDSASATVYTVPAGKTAMITSCFVTNHTSSQTAYDLAVVPAGETLALKHYIRWNFEVGANDFDLIDTRLTLGPADSIVVDPSALDELGITVFGTEFS